MTTNPKDTVDAVRYPDVWCGHVLDRPEPDLEDVKCTTKENAECGLTTPSAKEPDALPGQISRPVATHATVEAVGIDLSIKTTPPVCALKEPPPMDKPTPDVMGTRQEAEVRFMAACDKWIALRQPLTANAAAHKKRDISKHEARFQLANEAIHLAWFMRQENANG